MPASLISTLYGLVNRRLTVAAGEGIAERPEAAARALQLWFSALLAGLTRQSGDGAVTAAVAALLREPAMAGGMLSRVVANARRIVDVPQPVPAVQFPPQPRPVAAAVDPAVTLGQRLVSLALGDRRESLTRTVSAVAGVDHDKAGRLLGLAAPMVLAALAHRLSGSESGGVGLGAALGADRAMTLATVPAELALPLGFTVSDLASSRVGTTGGETGVSRTAVGRSEAVTRREGPVIAAPSASVPGAATPAAPAPSARVPDVSVPATTRTASVTAGTHRGGPTATASARPGKGDGWVSLLPSLVALLLVGLVAWLTWPQSPQVRPTRPQPPVAAPQPPPSPSGRSTESNEPRRTISILRTLPNGQAITIAADGYEAKLLGIAESRWSILNPTQWLAIEGLNFETASAEIRPESRETIQRLAEILKAYPTMRLKIGGYTDNQGDPQANQLLSEDRARAVRAALRELGIPGDRVEAEGFGDRDPVADNGTAEGRARNRRIGVLILAR